MHRRPFTISIVASLVLVAAVAGVAHARGRIVERDGGSFTETFFDEFIFDLCGIETYTTQTQRWSVKVFEDGSEIVHVTRTFVSEDPRIPVEKGAGTTFIAPDGTRAVVGSPTRLFDPDGGIRLIDAGRVVFDENGAVVSTSGQVSSLGIDLAPYYCP